jgi:hypothetical protein
MAQRPMRPVHPNLACKGVGHRKRGWRDPLAALGCSRQGRSGRRPTLHFNLSRPGYSWDLTGGGGMYAAWRAISSEQAR